MGMWVFQLMSWFIAAGYFLFFPGRVAVSIKFYQALFPFKGLFYALLCTWKQYQGFTQVFLDRFRLLEDDDITMTHEGWEYLEDTVSRKTGGILLMSHLGNWEIAAHMLKVKGRDNPDMKLLLYLGRKHKEQIEQTQKESLVRNGVMIIPVDKNGGSPADIVEGINFVKEGGFVSLSGDRRWRDDQRSISVRFLDHEAFLPKMPFALALLSGAPLFVFFAYRTGKKTYRFQISPPSFIRSIKRGDRDEAIRMAAQGYATLLENAVHEHPFEWYHFEPFIGRKLDAS